MKANIFILYGIFVIQAKISRDIPVYLESLK